MKLAGLFTLVFFLKGLNSLLSVYCTHLEVLKWMFEMEGKL